ncbi:MAG: hypothetical protein IJX14_07325, partial [Clostridia bacterium]|nr:hypothetical protein [Clostridia bacterium]
WDATDQLRTLDYAQSHFPPTDLFVEAPDYVFEGWGYDPIATGDARFIQPQPPEGWLYDPATGTFYPEDEDPPGANDGIDVWDELAAAYRAGVETA